MTAALLMAAFGFMGSSSRFWTQASTYAQSHEAEGMALDGAAVIVANASASGGSNVRFGPDASRRLTFSEEFNTAAGTVPNAAVWEHDVGKWTNELQTYTTAADNASTDGNGNLAITARKTSTGYTSGRIHTANSFAQAYGSFEARMKLPDVPGVLPAFWMLGANFKSVEWPACGEIDILEVPGDGAVHMSLHGKGDDSGVGITGQHDAIDVAQWHVYGIDWTPTSITWKIDGTPVRTVTKAQAGTMWSFDNPEFMILSLAVGGWSGTPPSSTTFPQTMLVDYVRAYAL